MSIETDKTGKGISNPDLAAVERTERGGVMRGIVATLSLIAVIEVLSSTAFNIPNAGVACMLAVAYAAYTGGARAGLVSAALVSLYIAWNFSIPGQLFHFSAYDFNRMMVLLVVAPAMAFMVGALRRRSRLYEEVVIANAALQARIAERETNEERLRLASSVFENAQEGIMVTDAANSIVTVNPAFTRISGYTAAEAVGNTPRMLSSGHHDKKFFQAMWASLAETGRWQDQICGKRKNGEIFWGWLSISTVKDATGGTTHYVGIVTDTTERTALEQKHHELLQHQRALLDGIADRAWLKDADGRYLAVNRNFADAAGFSPAQMIGKTAADLLPPDFATRIEAEDREVIRSGQVLRTERAGVLDEDETWREIIKVPIRSDDGRVIGLAVTARDITERRQTELALKESEEKYRAIMDYAGDAILIADLHGNLLDINRQGERLLGYTKDEIVKMRVPQIHPREELERVAAAFEAAGRGETAYYNDGFVLTKDGRKVPIDITANAIEYGGKKVGLAIFRDTTERKRAEAAVRASEVKLEELIGSVAEGVISIDEQLRIVLFNPAAGQMFGRSSEEMAGQPLSALLPERFRAQHDEHIRGFATTGQTSRGMGHYGVIYGLRASGEEFPIEATISQTGTAHNKLLTVILRDVTERSQMENALRESETRFRQLAENIREVFWVRDVVNERILYVSPAYEQIWGRKLASFDEANHSFQESIHPEDRQQLFASMQKPSRESREEVDEYRIVRPDGAIRWIRSRSFPIRDDSGTAYRIVGVAEDVTDTKQAEEERLSEAISQRDTLVREVHHRIKNNLQAVMGLLLQESYDHPELEHALKTAVLHVQMIAVVHGIQADPEADGIALCEMTPAIARNVESLMQSRIRVNVKIEMPRPAKVREKESVPVALILNELLVNAVKHSPETAAPKAIEVTISRDGNSALIRIVSHGNLPPQFNFAAGVGTGTGLGLVRSLMPRKGAELTFRRLSDGVEATLKLSAPVVDV
jgi:PAS domain S-box-containing protein